MKYHKTDHICCGMCRHFYMWDWSGDKDFTGHEWGTCELKKGSGMSYLLLAHGCKNLRKRFLWQIRPFKKCSDMRRLWNYNSK